MQKEQDGIVYAELLLKKPLEDTSPSAKGNATEYAEIVYVTSSSPSPSSPPGAEKKS